MEYQPPPGYKLISLEKDEESLPLDWKLLESEKGRRVYQTPPPRVLIQSRKQLENFQKSGKFLEFQASRAKFVKKTQRKPCFSNLLDVRSAGESKLADQDRQGEQNARSSDVDVTGTVQQLNLLTGQEEQGSSHDVVGGAQLHGDATPDELQYWERTGSNSDAGVFSMEVDQVAEVEADSNISCDVGEKLLETSSCSKTQQQLIKNDLRKISEAVNLLTVDPENNINHKVELENIVRTLSEARSAKADQILDFETLKQKVTTCETFESFCDALWSDQSVRVYFQEMQNSAYLEELIRIGRSYVDGPLKTFPPNVNQNIYSEIVKFSLLYCRETVMFLVNLVVKKDNPVTSSDVIREAFNQS